MFVNHASISSPKKPKKLQGHNYKLRYGYKLLTVKISEMMRTFCKTNW